MNVVVRPARVGRGVFAGRRFERGETIARIPGRVVHWRAVLRRGGEFLDNCFRYDEEHYLDPGRGIGRWLNHSCDPNAGVRKTGRQLYLYAARGIEPGEEIAIDYSTITGDDDVWRMKCKCGSRKCRTWISRFALLPERLKRSYVARGLVPDFLLPALEPPYGE